MMDVPCLYSTGKRTINSIFLVIVSCVNQIKDENWNGNVYMVLGAAAAAAVI